jgi:hypothetical protein
LADYPYFDKNDFDVIRFQVFEIWTNSKRCVSFKKIMHDYYQNVYLSHKKKNAEKTPAPQNFWPYSFQFYKSNPIKTFSCLVKNANSAPTVKIEYYVRPSIDRNSLSSELMPSVILNKKEFIYLIKHSSEKLIKENLANPKEYDEFIGLINKNALPMNKIESYMPFINEEMREFLKIRKAKPFTITTKHVRK